MHSSTHRVIRNRTHRHSQSTTSVNANERASPVPDDVRVHQSMDFGVFVDRLQASMNSCTLSHITNSALAARVTGVSVRLPVDILSLDHSGRETMRISARVPSPLDDAIRTLWADVATLLKYSDIHIAVVITRGSSVYSLVSGLAEKLRELFNLRMLLILDPNDGGGVDDVFVARILSPLGEIKFGKVFAEWLDDIVGLNANNTGKVVVICHDTEMGACRALMGSISNCTWSVSCTPSLPVSFVTPNGDETCMIMGLPRGHPMSSESRSLGIGRAVVNDHDQVDSMPQLLDNLEERMNTYNQRIRCSVANDGRCLDCSMLSSLHAELTSQPMSHVSLVGAVTINNVPLA